MATEGDDTGDMDKLQYLYWPVENRHATEYVHIYTVLKGALSQSIQQRAAVISAKADEAPTSNVPAGPDPRIVCTAYEGLMVQSASQVKM